MSIHGHVQNGMVVLDQPLPLPDGTRVRVEPVAGPDERFWHSPSLDELARQQDVAKPASVENLLGGWPADELDDQFEQAILDWRQSELERSR